jgi:hypothetical protein
MNILYTILTAVIMIVVFLLGMWSYQKGFRDGLNVTQGKTITPIIQNPVTAVKTAVDMAEVNKLQAEMERKFNEGMANILSYNGENQKIE